MVINTIVIIFINGMLKIYTLLRILIIKEYKVYTLLPKDFELINHVKTLY